MDIARFEGDQGLVTVISQRSRDGVITFAVFREFDRHGERDRTSFISAELGECFQQHVTKTLDAIRWIKSTWSVNGTPLPYPQGGRRPAPTPGNQNHERDRRRGRR